MIRGRGGGCVRERIVNEVGLVVEQQEILTEYVRSWIKEKFRGKSLLSVTCFK